MNFTSQAAETPQRSDDMKDKKYKVPVLFREHTQWVDVEATTKEEAMEKALYKANKGTGSKSWTWRLLDIDRSERTYEVVSFTANNKGYDNEEVSFLAVVA